MPAGDELPALKSCGVLLLELLQQYGVETVFGIPGNHTVELYRGLADSPLVHFSPRHEQGAGFMADGYARASGRPGVCLLISGPGLTNALTPMMQALADSVPLLVISAVARRHQLGMGEGRLHELPDQRLLASQCSRFSHTLMRPEELPKVMARAFTVFSSERPGPVHLEIPLDVIAAEAVQVASESWPVSAPPAGNSAAVRTAVSSLTSASRPVIIVGGGAIAATGPLTELAERLDAPVVNTVNAKGVVPADHPLAVGGSPSLAAVRNLIIHADVILALGTEFGETDYDMLFQGDMEPSAYLIRVDIDAQQLTRNQLPSLPICGDCREVVLSLLATLPQRRTDGEGRAQAARTAVRSEPHYHPEFQAIFDTLQQALPDLVLVGDSTLPTYYAVWQYESTTPRRYFHSATGGGTLGYAIPAAIGARLAQPELPVVALIGDGAAQFTFGELAAAASAGLSLIVIVWNNHGYREIKTGMEAAAVTPIGVDIPAPDFVAYARALGCVGTGVNNLSELDAALRAAINRAVPTVLVLDQADFISAPSGQWY